jgi:hypothetical protein
MILKLAAVVLLPLLAVADVSVFSTVGITTGETVRVDVVNFGDPSTLAPPCNGQLGFVNAAGTMLKSSNVSIPAGRAAFLTLTFSEASAATSAADTHTRFNVRPLVTLPPPCRSVANVEVFDAFLGRTHVYAGSIVPPDPTEPPGPPVFGIVGLTVWDTLRLNVTNITGSNGLPPGPCNVQMGFVNAAGDTIKSVNGTILPGRTASLIVNFNEAAGASTNALARLNLRPIVTYAQPCVGTTGAEIVDAFSSLTMVYIAPVIPPNVSVPGVIGTVAQ